MKILAIETSCDETAICLVEAEGDVKTATFKVLGNALLSQIDLHKEFGGIYPNLAKREHQKNLVPLLTKVFEESNVARHESQVNNQKREEIEKILEREPELQKQFVRSLVQMPAPEIDAIAVTYGPGLEPTLWVGINFAKALGSLWGKPVIPINHMEGHVLSSVLRETGGKKLVTTPFDFPALALLISGGHTELVLMREWLSYEIIGETLDDAVGEAFDKVARMLALPYPGGPEISKLAESAREKNEALEAKLPRPMLQRPGCDFSFAGLKTAVLYMLKNMGEGRLYDVSYKMKVAREFEDAVADVLWEKTRRALEAHCAKTLIVGGGVSANTHIRRVFEGEVKKQFPPITLLIPDQTLTGDNALMIAAAAYARFKKGPETITSVFAASGNIRLS